MVENFLNGGDVVALFRNALQHDNLCIALQPELKTLAELEGKRVGVLSDATSGQTGINARLTIEKAGATATYAGLGGYGNIYKALIAKGLSRSSTLEPQRKIGREECSVSVRRQ